MASTALQAEAAQHRSLRRSRARLFQKAIKAQSNAHEQQPQQHQQQNQEKQHDSTRKRTQLVLTQYGIAGLAAYGLMNALYYSCALLATYWSVGVPTGLGRVAALKRVAGVMGVVWVGSQVTKLPRAAGAATLAPLMDRVLSTIACYTHSSKTYAFVLICAISLALFAFIFTLVIARTAL